LRETGPLPARELQGLRFQFARWSSHTGRLSRRPASGLGFGSSVDRAWPSYRCCPTSALRGRGRASRAPGPVERVVRRPVVAIPPVGSFDDAIRAQQE
jgi:hypothetical protein